MARTVTDAAIMLGALEGNEPDPNDAATSRCEPPPGGDYRPFLRADALQGARIGIPRALYYDSVAVSGGDDYRGGLFEDGHRIMSEAIAVLREQGAEIIDYLIAGVCLARSVPLWTRNRAHFGRVPDLELLSVG